MNYIEDAKTFKNKCKCDQLFEKGIILLKMNDKWPTVSS